MPARNREKTTCIASYFLVDSSPHSHTGNSLSPDFAYNCTNGIRDWGAQLGFRRCDLADQSPINITPDMMPFQTAGPSPRNPRRVATTAGNVMMVDFSPSVWDGSNEYILSLMASARVNGIRRGNFTRFTPPPPRTGMCISHFYLNNLPSTSSLHKSFRICALNLFSIELRVIISSSSSHHKSFPHFLLDSSHSIAHLVIPFIASPLTFR